MANSQGVAMDWLSPNRAMDDLRRMWMGVDWASLEVGMVVVVWRDLVEFSSWTCFNPDRVSNSAAASAPETSWMNIIEQVRETESFMVFCSQFNCVEVLLKIV